MYLAHSSPIGLKSGKYKKLLDSSLCIPKCRVKRRTADVTAISHASKAACNNVFVGVVLVVGFTCATERESKVELNRSAVIKSCMETTASV